MSMMSKLAGSPVLASHGIKAGASRSFVGTDPVTATPTATAVPAIQIASAMVTAAGVGAAGAIAVNEAGGD